MKKNGLFFLLFLFLIFFLNQSFLPVLTVKNKKLAVPRLSSVALPSPLFLPQLNLNVLGTQKIIPADIIKYVNIEREKRGSPPLLENEKLDKAAKMRADVILKYQNFSHQDPYENIELVTVLPKVGYHFSYASENIGMGGVSAEDFVGGFMHSTSHRENLLNPDLVQSGTAVVTGPYKQYYVNIAVQLFAVPSTREEYLGYNNIDKKNYRTLLTRINFELNPVIVEVGNLFTGQKNKEKITKLKKQREILSLLYKKMEEEKPFDIASAKLIEEYNTYL